MGSVYRAVDESLGRTVAIKVVRPDLVDPAALERLRREARAGAALSDPHVAGLLDVVSSGGAIALILEWIPGGSLKDRLKTEGRLPWWEAAALGAEVARGLAALHRAGLVHRDVKPANVLLDAEGRAKLADLGLVKPAVVSRDLTATGMVVGTYEYLAPEQQGSDPVGPPADLYALGATLHELIAGSPPFEGEGFALLKMHLLDTPRSLRALAPETPPELERLVLRLLAKEPAARGESAESVARELEAIASASPRKSLFLPIVVGVVVVGFGVGLAISATTSRRPTAPPQAPGPAPAPVVKPRVSAGPLVKTPLILRDPSGRPQSIGALSLDATGERILVSGAWTRFHSLFLDARTHEVVSEEFEHTSLRWDERGERLYGARATGEIVARRSLAPEDVVWSMRPDLASFYGSAEVQVQGPHVFVTLTGAHEGRLDPVLVLAASDGREIARFPELEGSGDLFRSVVECPRSGRLFLSRYVQPYHVAQRRFVLVLGGPKFETIARLDGYVALGADPRSGRIYLRRGEDVAFVDPPRSATDPVVPKPLAARVGEGPFVPFADRGLGLLPFARSLTVIDTATNVLSVAREWPEVRDGQVARMIAVDPRHRRVVALIPSSAGGDDLVSAELEVN